MLLHMHVTSGEKAAASFVFLLPPPMPQKNLKYILFSLSLMYHTFYFVKETIANDWCMQMPWTLLRDY